MHSSMIHLDCIVVSLGEMHILLLCFVFMFLFARNVVFTFSCCVVDDLVCRGTSNWSVADCCVLCFVALFFEFTFHGQGLFSCCVVEKFVLVVFYES